MRVSGLTKGLAAVVFCAAVFGGLKNADAGYLTITGKPALKVEHGEGGIRLSGTYEITNSGDESSQKTFPSFRVGDWLWAGDPRVLAPNGRESWKVDARIPAVPRGIVPLLVTRFYQDNNGYQFSAPDVLLLEPSGLTEEQLSRLRVPSILTSFAIKGPGQRFRGTVSLRNTASKPVQANVRFFTGREILVHSEPRTVTVQPGQVAEVSFSAENEKALVGSTYAVTAITEWEEDGLRHAATAVDFIRVEKVSHRWLLIVAVLAALVALGAGLWWKLRR